MATSTIQSNDETIKTRQDEGGWTHYTIDQIVECDRKTVIEDVKRLIEAKENGQTSEQLRSEILRLYHVIVDGHMQDAVIEGCGKRSLLKVLRMARKIRSNSNTVNNNKKANKKNENKSILTKEDKEKRKINNAIRDSWIRWFRGVYGMNGKQNMPEKLFNAIMTAASKVDFIELSKSCKSDAQFYQNGLSDCYKIAKSEDFYKATRRKRVEKNYSLQGSPYITRKDWGSLYKPGRG